jgi:hypothetical protein
MTRTRKFVIEVADVMSEEDTRDYILDAVQTWGRQCFPGDCESPPDPRFEICDHPVSLKRYQRPRRSDP